MIVNVLRITVLPEGLFIRTGQLVITPTVFLMVTTNDLFTKTEEVYERLLVDPNLFD